MKANQLARPNRALLLCAALALGGCGGASVERKTAIRVCVNRPAEDRGRCLHPFNVERSSG